MIGVPGKRAVIARKGIGPSAELRECETEIRVGRGMLGLQLHGDTEQLGGTARVRAVRSAQSGLKHTVEGRWFRPAQPGGRSDVASTRESPLEFGAEPLEYAAPVSVTVLAEERHRRVPRAVTATLHPAPVRTERQQHPRRFAERAREVRDARVDADHEIDALAQGCRVRKVCLFGRKIEHRRRRERRSVAGPHVALQAHILECRRQIRQQVGERNATHRIAPVARIAAPHEPYAHAATGRVPTCSRRRPLGNPRTPSRYALGGRAQIADGPGNRLEGRVERERQTQQRTVVIEGGRRLAAGHQPSNACESLEQTEQGFLHLQDHARTAFRQRLCVAAELQRVAEPLLRMQQYGLARQRLAAPPRSSDSLAGLQTQTPFVLLPAASKLPLSEENEGPVDMGLGVIRFERERPIAAL